MSMSDRDLLTQVLSEVRYVKQRQDEFIDQVHQWRVEANEVHAEQDKRIDRVQDQMNNLVWIAGKVALGVAAIVHGVGVMAWLAFKTWIEG
jgi:hypothetical protein